MTGAPLDDNDYALNVQQASDRRHATDVRRTWAVALVAALVGAAIGGVVTVVTVRWTIDHEDAAALRDKRSAGYSTFLNAADKMSRDVDIYVPETSVEELRQLSLKARADFDSLSVASSQVLLVASPRMSQCVSDSSSALGSGWGAIDEQLQNPVDEAAFADTVLRSRWAINNEMANLRAAIRSDLGIPEPDHPPLSRAINAGINPCVP